MNARPDPLLLICLALLVGNGSMGVVFVVDKKTTIGYEIEFKKNEK